MMIVMGMYLVVSVVGMAERTIIGSQQYNEDANLQDGQFTTFIPIDNDKLNDLSAKYGRIEKAYYFDALNSDGKMIRVFKNRQNINLAKLNEGSIPENDNEIFVMNLYAQRNSVSIGDDLKLAGHMFTVSGIGSLWFPYRRVF